MDKRNILVIKDNYEGYLALVGCVMQKRKLDLILQIEDHEEEHFDLHSSFNDWLIEKKLPPITASVQVLTVLNTIERLRSKQFNGFPSDVVKQLEGSNGTLIDMDYKSLAYYDCVSEWDWDYQEIADSVFNLSDLPEDIKVELQTLSEDYTQRNSEDYSEELLAS